MFALRVIKHLDTVEHVLPCFVSCSVCYAANAFSFQQIEKALRDSIVVTVAPAASFGITNVPVELPSSANQAIGHLPHEMDMWV